MIRDLLLVVDNATKAKPFLDAGVAFAGARDAHSQVLVLTAGPLLAAEFAPLGGLYVTEDALRRDEFERIAEVRGLLRDAEHVEVSGIHDDVAWLPHALQAIRPAADLCAVASEAGWDIPWLRRRTVETLLLSSSTPLLLLPDAAPFPAFRRIVLGWKASREASRAVHDLVALAEPGAEIELLVAASGEGAVEAMRQAEQVTRHLQRHDFTARVEHRNEAEEGVADLLQKRVAETGADLLAVGGYAHSRVREAILGGVTRALIAHPRIPVLLSH